MSTGRLRLALHHADEVEDEGSSMHRLRRAYEWNEGAFKAAQRLKFEAVEFDIELLGDANLSNRSSGLPKRLKGKRSRLLPRRYFSQSMPRDIPHKTPAASRF